MRTLVLSVSFLLLSHLAGAQEATPAAPVSAAPPDAAAPAAGQSEPIIPAHEDKRAYGVLPNYRTVEGSTPFVPLTAKQKLTIATKDTIDGPSYIMAGLFSGLYQLTDSNPSFGQGLKGYAKRYGAAIADQDVGNYMTEGFLPVLLHEDPRYFRRGQGSFLGRAVRAAGGVVVSKTDRGTPTFNFSEFVGNGISASVGNAYYSDGVGFTPTVERMFTAIGTDAISNVLKEFWPDFKRKVLKKSN